MSRVVARRVVVRGLVQGVNFRWWVADRARSRGVVGWAENRGDGAVEVFVQGAPDDVAAVERDVRAGPRHARVDAVEADDAEPRAGLDGFARR
ncbi:MAG TPA: acylphosphatase [Baekduia sp.]